MNQSTSELWYSRPAERWFEALPVGNGRLGGMVYSGVSVERIQLAETTAWSGAPSERDVNPRALSALPLIREHLGAGRYREAQAMAERDLLGRKPSFGTNLPLPELRLSFAGRLALSSYRRSVDLMSGIVRTELGSSAGTTIREVFASHPDRVLVIRLQDAAGFDLSFGDGVFPFAVTTDDDTLVLDGRAVENLHSDGRQGVDLQVRVRIVAGPGEVKPLSGGLSVGPAPARTILVAIGTSWDGHDPETDARVALVAASSYPYPELRRRHVADHAGLMERAELDLGPSAPEIVALPFDARRDRFAEGGEDPELIAAFFQYGRYLTVAGSRADSPLPLALQGLWNDGRASSASWTNDFHLDMNTQQNYWAAEVTGLAECHEPLMRLVERLSIAGRATAGEMYGASGWVAHTVTNAWGYSAPGTGPGWGLHVTAGAWIALHLWDHYDYGRDPEFLRSRAYPVLKGAAEFFLGYLSPEPGQGWLVSGPSESPENWFLSPDGDRCSVSMGSTCDRVFIAAVFDACAEASALLGADHEFAARVRAARDRLPPLQIGKHGQLQEWLHDFDEAIPSHRHTSHLCALFPERQIDPRRTPELARAAEVTLARRLSARGWEQTEWVEANLIAFYARLLDGERAADHLHGLIADTAESNLLTYSAGGVAGAAENIYSFDGNAGATAGIAEMLLQSDGEEIELLPALPSTWREGSVSGLRARGGFRADIHWRENRLARATISSDRGGRVRVRIGERIHELNLGAGETAELQAVE